MFDRQVEPGEALVKNELQKVRDWAEARIKAGNVPDWSWHHHVELIEAVDVVLHDISVANDASKSAQRAGQNPHLVERHANVNAKAHAGTKRKAGAFH